jgi:hypothetical protein
MAKRGRPPKALGKKVYTLYVYENENGFSVVVAGKDCAPATGECLSDACVSIGKILAESDVNEMAKSA